MSGLTLNTSKTKGLLLGRLRLTRNKIQGIDFSATAIKSLGVYFGTSKQECLQLNWNKIIEDIQNLLNSWKRRKLTFFGENCSPKIPGNVKVQLSSSMYGSS